MRIAKILVAAGLALSAMTMSAGVAQAQHRYDHGRYHRYERHGWHDRGWHRGRAYGWRGPHRRCCVEWRYHRRVTICR